MGTTYTENVKTRKQAVELHTSDAYMGENLEFLDKGTSKNGYFVAIRNKRSKEDFVVFLKMTKHDGLVGVKDIPLEFHPYYYDMPKKLLKYVDSEKCKSWLEGYDAYAKELEEIKKIKDGTLFEFRGEKFEVDRKKGSYFVSYGNKGSIYRFKGYQVIQGLIKF